MEVLAAAIKNLKRGQPSTLYFQSETRFSGKDGGTFQYTIKKYGGTFQ